MQGFFSAVWENPVLPPALTAWAVAQVLKALLSYYKLKEFSLERLLGAGGMPSSHSALVVSLTTAVALTEGAASVHFALASVFSGIVMYDATGVRQAAGKHARAINQIVRQLRDTHTLDEKGLKEFLGHTPVEVIAGALLGFAIAVFFVKG